MCSVFFNKKKIEKDSDDFLHRKLILKVKFWHFLTPSHPILKIQQFPLGKLILRLNLSDFVPTSLENSTTRITKDKTKF